MEKYFKGTLLLKNIKYNSDRERVLVNLGLKFTLIGIATTLFAISLYFILDLHQVVLFSLFIPLVTLIFNLYLLRKKKHNLAPFLALIAFAISEVIIKYYYPSIYSELLLITVFLAVLSGQNNRYLLMISIGILAITLMINVVIIFQLPLNTPIDETKKQVIELLLLLNSFLAFAVVFVEFKKSERLHQTTIQQKNQEILLQKEMLAAEEKKTHELQMQQKERDLNTMVVNNQMKVTMKKKLLQELITLSKSKDNKKQLKSLILKLKQEIQTEKKLHLIEENTADINANFYDQLHQLYPTLSKTEIEICSYLKINLGTKEIADLRNTTTNAINVTKFRIRKKMNIPKDASLENFIQQI